MSLNISLSHSRSLKVISKRHHSIDRLRVVLAVHSNYVPVVYHFRDKKRYLSKITIFSYPRVPLHSTVKKFGIWLLCWLHAHDRQQERQTDTARRHRPRLCNVKNRLGWRRVRRLQVKTCYVSSECRQCKMVGKMRWIDEFSGLDGMNAGLTQQWLLTSDCSTHWRQRQETLGHPVTTF